MEFPVKVLSVFHCPANNHQPLSLFLASTLTRGQPELGPRVRQGGQMDQQELVRGWQCQGMVEGMERKERKVGGRLGRGRIYQQIEWNIVWFRPHAVGGGEWARGQREGGGEAWVERGLVDCQETVGERLREWRGREGWRADRCHSPGPQHRKSFILGSACCRLPLSTPERSHSW